MTLAAQEQAKAQVGGVGINVPNPQASLHIGNGNGAAGLIFSQIDTSLVPNLTTGHIVRHTDGNHYTYNGTQRVPFGSGTQ